MTEQNKLYDPFEHEPMPEGVESAPPLTRTMSVVRWAILGGMVLFAFIMVLGYFGAAPWAHDGSEPLQYHCPMHPTYVSNQPGDCPICGMSLVPVDSSGPAEAGNDEAGMTEPSAHAQHGESDISSAPVPDLVPVTLEPRRLQLIGVRTGAVGRHSLDGNIRLVGFIAPDETRVADLNLRFGGWVKELHVNQTGQRVSRGEKLLSVYSQELYQAEQDYAVARQTLERGSPDNELAATRRDLLDAARQRLELLGVPADELSRLDRGGPPNADLWMTSPFSGYVMQKNVVVGHYVTPGQNLFSIVDLSRVWVLADVYERDIVNVRVGQKARMTMAARAGDTFAGEVGFIYPSVSEQTRTLKVRLEFQNSSMTLLPGMYAEVELEGSDQPVLAVPADAVMDDGDKQYVFVVHDAGQFEPRLVTVGRASDDFMEVLSGLSEGELVVTSANFLIDSESRLKAAMVGMADAQPGVHEGHGQ